MVYLSENRLLGILPHDLCSHAWELQELYLDENQLHGGIPVRIGDCTNLQIASLSSNRFSGSIPATIGNCSVLRELYLDNNNLTGNSIYSFGEIPLELGYLNALQKLALDQNRLSGLIPWTIFNISSMLAMSFTDNELSGNLPPTLGSHLPNLEWLSVEVNNLNGSIPPSISNASKLELLALARNSFSGNPSFLTSLTSCKSLESFRLTGSIPRNIHKLKKLQALSLNHNELHGVIPNQLCELPSLFGLNLEDNNFSGQIPECFPNVTSLREVYLGFNMLSSVIPSSFWDLTYLLDFSLARNNLIGSISPRLGNFKDLISMDLSGNQLSGDIPATIGNLVSLEFLDLSANNLTGIIPKTMESLRYLKQLNVSQNGLWGEIPNGGPFANMSSESFLLNPDLCGLPKFGVQQCTQGHNKHFDKLLIAVVVSIVLSLAIVAFTLTVMLRRRKKSSEERNKVKEELLASLTWRRISLLELQRATDGFDDCNLLGKGSFGRVYKGVLADDTNVAIKVFNELEGEADGNDTECEVLRNLRHRNLIKIISTCYTTGFKALVLEFMPNGSLHKWLYSHNYFLDIFKRLDILIDVASALEYLHQGYSIPVVHCDLKPSNVLLDGDLVAHLADFGISKFIGSGDSMTQTLTLATIGYMAPEFGMDGIVSTKSDVYSFGILVMEVFTRRNPTEESFQEGMSMKQWVTTLVPEGVTKYADANLLNCNSNRDFKSRESCISSIMKLALECCADTPRDRLAINDVLANLRKIKSQLQQDLCRRA
ncbi:unnamed protein product [Linum tenue]|uniref:non-specific serine/threonine protein kinase n=1 Tax=Linum tenue TaxID=586396 RepID=A0AAV0S9I4_9ROSI|nr:unnamed protein product [Linum tenue]